MRFHLRGFQDGVFLGYRVGVGNRRVYVFLLAYSLIAKVNCVLM